MIEIIAALAAAPFVVFIVILFVIAGLVSVFGPIEED